MIEWTNETWNPLAGCTRKSPGCDNCYAAAMALRLEAMALAKLEKGEDPKGVWKYLGVAKKNGRGVAAFTGQVNTDDGALDIPKRWKKPRLIFVNSMSDLFHPNAPDAFIDKVFDVMAKHDQHTYQILTKRPERMAAYVEQRGETLRNVWLGVSVEDQIRADERIPELIRCRDYAPVLWLSVEPMLGPIVIDEDSGALDEVFALAYIRWVVCGGESGPNARPMHPEWVRDLRDQCREAGVPFHFKQWGEWFPRSQWEHNPELILPYDEFCVESETVHIFEDGEIMHKVGKYKADRLLYGREWNEYPDAASSNGQKKSR